MQQVFPTDRPILAGKFPSCFEDKKRDSDKFYKVLQLLTTWLNLFLDEFNQKSRRINKQNA